MKSLFLSIVMALLLPQFGQAKFAEEELFEKWGKPFIEESLGMIHKNLALAVLNSNYYEACLTDNDSWFDKEKVIYPNNPYFEKKRKGNGIFSLYIKEFCGGKVGLLPSIRNAIKEKYPLMRAYMIIAMGDSPGYVGFQDFYGLADLPDFSEDEKRLAEQIFNKNVSASKTLLEQENFLKIFKMIPSLSVLIQQRSMNPKYGNVFTEGICNLSLVMKKPKLRGFPFSPLSLLKTHPMRNYLKVSGKPGRMALISLMNSKTIMGQSWMKMGTPLSKNPLRISVNPP